MCWQHWRTQKTDKAVLGVYALQNKAKEDEGKKEDERKKWKKGRRDGQEGRKEERKDTTKDLQFDISKQF